MKAQIVSFYCILRNKVGGVISSTFNHNVITHTDGPDTLLFALAEGLQNLKKGEKRKISLSADKAYGFYNPQLVFEVSRRGISEGRDLETGHQLLTQTDEGEVKMLRVIETSSDSIVLDGNHPLAGQDLVFEIEATDARDATPEEIAESELKKSPTLYH